jgi:hypothetical protein
MMNVCFENEGAIPRDQRPIERSVKECWGKIGNSEELQGKEETFRV